VENSKTVSVSTVTLDKLGMILTDPQPVAPQAVPDQAAPGDPERQALSLACGDFNRDGIPDLLAGYGLAGGGVLEVFPGSALRPAPGDTGTAPFRARALSVNLPAPPDFLASGDFNADGFEDVVFASRNTASLYWLIGNGRGGLTLQTGLPLPGAVTGLLVGDFNRRDGLADVALGVLAADGQAQLLIFEHPGGALLNLPENIALSNPAVSLAAGYLDGDPFPDLAVAAGNEVLILAGRDRALWQPLSRRAGVAPLSIARQSFPGPLVSVSLGDFSAGRSGSPELAVLAQDGRLWWYQPGSSPALALQLAADTKLVSGRIAAQPVDTLLGLRTAQPGLTAIVRQTEGITQAPVETHSPAVAVLPMRLNGDALADLVIFAAGSAPPFVQLSAPAATFVVNSTGDQGDPYGPDGICDTTGDPISHIPYSGVCTLRAALGSTSGTSGADLVTFSLGTGVHTIQPVSDAVGGFFGPSNVTIQANLGSVIIDGSLLTSSTKDCLKLEDNGVVSGLVFNHCADSAIVLDNANNVVKGNIIGADVSGTTAVPNHYGVKINGPNNTVGGTTLGDRNLISGNYYGVTVTSYSNGAGNTILGNWIGVNQAGTAALPNSTGIQVGMSSNLTIGGTVSTTPGGACSGACNLISGNTLNGIYVFGSSGTPLNATNLLILGNFIGTNSAGTGVIAGQSGGGICISSSDAYTNTIGGTTPAARNLISGSQIGISFIGKTHDNLIQGNFIGTDTSGSLALGNRTSPGIVLANAHTNTIGGIIVPGGPCSGACNLISGNKTAGIQLQQLANNNTILGNFIGPTLSGLAALPNGMGIYLDKATNTLIGGAGGGEANLISGNTGNGVLISPNESINNKVFGNWIGLNVTGELGLGNGGDGVGVYGTGNQVGSPYPGEGNRIAYNSGDGVDVSGSPGSWIGLQTKVIGNSIYWNQGLGINLGPAGVTPNDALDGDEGANGLQNYPEISGVVIIPTGSALQGSLSSKPNLTYRLDFYANTFCDSSQSGEGEQHVATQNVTTDGSGLAPFNIEVPGNGFYTATATDDQGNTSEFSRCVGPEVLVTLTSNPSTQVAPGQRLQYTLALYWDSPTGTEATNNSLDALIPLYTQFVSGSESASHGTVSFVNGKVHWVGSLPDEETVTIQYTVKVDECPALFNQIPGDWPLNIIATASGIVNGNNFSALKNTLLLRPDLVVSGLEVTQSIQNLNNSVTLITDRWALARVFVQAIPPQGVTTCDVPGVSATLESSTGAPLRSLNGPITALSEPVSNRPSTTERRDLDQSLNFYVPIGTQPTAGTVNFTAEVNPTHTRPDAAWANNQKVRTLTYAVEPPLELFLYNIHWKQFPFGQEYVAGPKIGPKLVQHILAIYPFPSANVYYIDADLLAPTLMSPGVTTYLRVAHILGMNLALDKLSGKASPAAVAYGYLGAAADKDRPDGGLTHFIGHTAAGGTSVLDGTLVASHELGHIFGLTHVDGKPDSFCDEPYEWIGWPWIDSRYPHPKGLISTNQEGYVGTAYFGYDSQRNLVLNPHDYYDIMTYCGSARWASNYTWDNIRAAHPIRGAAAAADPHTNGEYLVVSGIFNLTQNTVELFPFYRLPDQPAQPLPTPGDYAIRLLNGETVLAAYPVSLVRAVDLPEGADDLAPLVEAVPYLAGTTRIQVVHGASVLAERAVSANAPSVNFAALDAKETAAATITLNWTASDLDGDALSYALFYSADAGQTWRTIATDLTATSYTLDTTRLAGSSQAQLRLLATDGVNTSATLSGLFSVSPKAPQAVIVSPEAADMPAGQPLILEGAGWDAEDGTLSGAALVWREGSTMLGTGASLVLSAPAPGWHTLTLTASDASGASAVDSVTFYAGSRTWMPAVRR
jgi:hypothetical protein